MPVGFRPAGPPDLEPVHALRRAFHHEDGSPWREAPARRALAALLAEPAHGLVWVAEDDGEIVGYVVLAFGYSLEFLGRDAFVDELYLRPSHRRRGLGRAALRVVEDACRAHAVRALHLEVDAANARARALYRTWGFAARSHLLMTRWIEAAEGAPGA